MVPAITPSAFLDLLTLCLSWEWEEAEGRYRESLGSDKTLWPHLIGYTTVDKVVRILHGLEILTTKQRKALYKNRRTQFLVLHNSHQIRPGDSLPSIRETTDRRFILRCDAVEDVNRERMLRNMIFFISEAGTAVAESLCDPYTEVLTKNQYLAEIKRQEDIMSSKSAAGKVSIVDRYRRNVDKETS